MVRASALAIVMLAALAPGAGAAGPPGASEAALHLQDAFAAVAEKVGPSVVCVTGYVRDDPPGGDGDPEGWAVRDGAPPRYPGYRPLRSGSGLALTADGDVLCCRHVLSSAEGTLVDLVDVELHNQRRFLARIVGTEPTIDLAVLRIEEATAPVDPALTPIDRGVPGEARVGNWALAVADPAGPRRTFAVGALAALPERQCYQGEMTTTFLQASLAVPPGSAGGALADIRGVVLGVLMPGEPGLTYAFPIDVAWGIYESLKAKETHRSPWLGVSVLAMSGLRNRFDDVREYAATVRPPHGVYIDDVYAPGPAASAGIRPGDFITAIDGHRVAGVLDFQKWLYLSGVGRTVEVELFRDGAPFRRDLTIEARPAGAALK